MAIGRSQVFVIIIHMHLIHKVNIVVRKKTHFLLKFFQLWRFTYLRSLTKYGTAPWLTTHLVWSAVPEAMLVNAQAASNWSWPSGVYNSA